jgi:hypothetical protein
VVITIFAVKNAKLLRLPGCCAAEYSGRQQGYPPLSTSLIKPAAIVAVAQLNVEHMGVVYAAFRQRQAVQSGLFPPAAGMRIVVVAATAPDAAG